MENYLELNYEKNLDMLSLAVKYCEQNFLHDDLIKELYLEDDLKKQICIIKIKSLNSQPEADILVQNLINHAGPIRETTAFKINELIRCSEFCRFFQTDKILDIFTKAITDINPSVSRNTVEFIKYIDNAQYLYTMLIKETNKTLFEIKEGKQYRSYDLNKKNFNLYWNLEAIVSIMEKISPQEELLEILKKTLLSNDYTIREKTAKTAFAAAKKNNIFNEILYLLQNDSNIYVKKYCSVIKKHR